MEKGRRYLHSVRAIALTWLTEKKVSGRILAGIGVLYYKQRGGGEEGGGIGKKSRSPALQRVSRRERGTGLKKARYEFRKKR